MNRLLFVSLLILLVAGVIGLFFFKINPIGSNTAYVFFLLTALVIVTGLRRKSLGLPFLPKYGFFSKERYEELIKLFSEK
jgi:hypothetical protein